MAEMISKDVLRDLVDAGIKAPSADNSQPWKFRLLGDGVEVWPDPDRVGMFFDADLAATRISIGAVLENMRLRAVQLGWNPSIDFAASASLNAAMATVHLRPGQPPEDKLATVLDARATHRGLYRRRLAVSDQHRHAMDAALQTLPGARIHWADTKARRDALIQATVGADLVRYTHPIIHRDFHAKLRFGPSADQLRDGLAADTLGIEKLMLPFLRLLAPWPVARFLNAFGLHHFMAWRGCALPMSTAPCLGAIVAAGDMSDFEMGRALQRVWLASTECGLAFQPLGALPLLLLRLRRLNGAGLDERQQGRLNQMDALWRAAFALKDPSLQLLMIFRVGHAGSPPVHARRRPVNGFMLADNR